MPESRYIAQMLHPFFTSPDVVELPVQHAIVCRMTVGQPLGLHLLHLPEPIRQCADMSD
jgi:hypothetical protein